MKQCLSRAQVTSIWCRETQEWITGAGKLLQPLNRGRWRLLKLVLGSVELESWLEVTIMVAVVAIAVGGVQMINSSGGLGTLIPHC